MSAGARALLDEVIEAHGGLERWRSASEIRARVRSGGLLVRTRFPGNRMADYQLTLDTRTAWALFDPFPTSGRRGVFDAGRTRIESEQGETIEARDDPRSAFKGALGGIRRNFRWDALDATYFAGYAMWNYLTTPYLLTREGMEVREGAPWSEDGEEWRRLEVTFPDGLDTHSRSQTFFIDRSGLIRRHDYTAEPVGGWAKAAHYCAAHREFNGLVFPTRRRVVPRGLGNRALPGPTLVSLELDRISVT
jgi:hypothetical protein